MEAEFLKDVNQHQIDILHEDGIYRHIRFKNPNTMCQYFDLVTYPNYLVYSGDMGHFVFCRTTDMFDFFRVANPRADKSKIYVNLGYWSEKLVAPSPDKAEEFVKEIFERKIMEYLISWIRENKYKTTKESRRELWEDVVDSVIGADEARIQFAAYDFSHFIDGIDFCFYDLFEVHANRYTHRFTWCCYAIAWGIKQYDELKHKLSKQIDS